MSKGPGRFGRMSEREMHLMTWAHCVGQVRANLLEAQECVRGGWRASARLLVREARGMARTGREHLAKAQTMGVPT